MLAILAFVWLVSVNLGFDVWPYLKQPGKDPMGELTLCGLVGLFVTCTIYGLNFKHTWRLTPRAVVVAMILGLMTGLSAIVCRLLDDGWY